MKKNVVAYPLSSSNTIFAQYNDLLKDINIIGLISGELGSKYSNNSSIPIYSDINNGLSKADTLLIMPLSDSAKINRILQQIEFAIQNGINILSMHQFDPKVLMQISEKCDENNVVYKQLTNQEPAKYDDLEDRVWDINTPLVVCGGLTDQCSLPQLELELRKRFLNGGYNVSQIGSFNHANVFGFHSSPSFLYDNTINEVEKTLQLNRYIKEIETMEQPEVFILGIPKALCSISDKYHLGFGNIPFIMSHAFSPDYTIINMNVGEHLEEYLENLKSVLQYRFNLKPDSWVMSNMTIDLSDTDYGSTVRYFSCDERIVSKAINISANHFANINSKDDLDSLYANIVDNLSRN